MQSSFTTFTTLILLATSVLSSPTPLVVDADTSLEARQACPQVQVYFARGTGEPGTIGNQVGPQFSSALSSQLAGRSVSFIGISYPAVIAGYLTGGDRGGAQTMANAVTSTANRCPGTRIVMSGYSQGAQVTHLAARQLSAAVQNRVVAVVTFGDPYSLIALPGVLQGRRRTFCNLGDLICAGQPIVLPPHTTYGANAGEAAAFVRARV